jgi:AsmA family protein
VMLRDTEEPYPLDLDVTFGATKLRAKGTVMDPFQWKGADVDLTLSGHDLADIYPLLGIPGPPTPPYNITGKLHREAGIWKFLRGRWHVGDSDLVGDVTIDERRKPELLIAKLVSQKLVFADLVPLVGAPPDKPAGNVSPQQRQVQQQLEARGDLFPNVPLKVEKLRAMNMDVTLDAKRVLAPSYLPVQALSFRVVVQDGVATAKPLTLILLGDGQSAGAGKIAGELVVDAKTDTPRVRTSLVLSDIELRNFFRNSQYFDATYGKVQGRVALAGVGRSLAQVMSTADGHIAAALGGGSVSSLMVSLAGLQIFDALILYVTGDHRIPIKCAVGRLNFNHGTVAFDRTLLDTQKSVLYVQGQASLVTQAVKAEVDADAKQFDLLDLHGAVIVQGKLRQPQISLGRIFPIPTPVIGTAKDVACAATTQQLFSGQ